MSGTIFIGQLLVKRKINKSAGIEAVAATAIASAAGAVLGATDCTPAFAQSIPASVMQYVPSAVSLVEKAQRGALLAEYSCAGGMLAGTLFGLTVHAVGAYLERKYHKN